MKVVNVQATFPSLKGGNACQQGRGEGCNVTSATRAAIADMFKPHQGPQNIHRVHRQVSGKGHGRGHTHGGAK